MTMSGTLKRSEWLLFLVKPGQPRPLEPGHRRLLQGECAGGEESVQVGVGCLGEQEKVEDDEERGRGKHQEPGLAGLPGLVGLHAPVALLDPVEGLSGFGVHLLAFTRRNAYIVNYWHTIW